MFCLARYCLQRSPHVLRRVARVPNHPQYHSRDDRVTKLPFFSSVRFLSSTPAHSGISVDELFKRGIDTLEGSGNGVLTGDQVQDAMDMVLAAAAQGHAEANFYLGLAYDGLLARNPIEENPEAAARAYRRAAEAGHAEAAYNLATSFRDGDGVTLDLSLAAEWYIRAAEAGDARAQYQLGLACDVLHQKSALPGLELDNDEAAAWYRRAAENGRHWKAHTNLGIFYWLGLSTEIEALDVKDRRSIAIEMWEVAAEKGDISEAKMCLRQAADEWQD